jgi:hypothetical protein
MRTVCAAIAACVMSGLLADAPSQAPASDLKTVFRAEIELAARNLRMRPGDLDEPVALAAAASGVSWRPVSDGIPLLRASGKHLAYTEWEGRRHGLAFAERTGDTRSAFAFALSMVLDPYPEGVGWRDAYGHVSRYGEGLDAVLVGVLIAPDRVPLLPSLSYAAADVLVWRADPRFIQLWLGLAESGDPYLRSRAIAALGLIAYDPADQADATSDRVARNAEGPAGAALGGLLAPVRAWPISATQRRIVEDVVERAATHGSHRVRAASAMALGLAMTNRARELLLRLAKDPAFVCGPADVSGRRHVEFPVRDVARAGLTRHGLNVARSGGLMAPSEIRQATRKCRDVTRDTSGLRKDRSSRVRFYDGSW